MHLEIWYAYDITLNCFWSLRAKSVEQYAILDDYHHSWYFCDFLEAFKQTHKVRPKTPLYLKEFFRATFTYFYDPLPGWLPFLFYSISEWFPISKTRK